MLTVAEMIRYRMETESHVIRVGEAMLPTRHGEFRMIAFENQLDGESHVALVKGDVESATDPCWCACTHIVWRATFLAARFAIASRCLIAHWR